MNLKKIIYLIILPTLLLISSCAKDSNFVEYLNTQIYQCNFEDSNGDNNIWQDTPYDDESFGGSGSSIMYRGNYNRNADDWAFTPNKEIYLEAYKVYSLSFYTKCSDNYYSERIEVKCGQSHTSSSMLIDIMDATVISSESWDKYTNSFSVMHSGYYYIGFHAISYANKRELYVDNIKITAIN